MKKFSAIMLLVLCTTILHGQKTRYGQAPPFAKPGVDYPIKVHISGIHIRSYCTSVEWTNCEDVAYMDVLMNGKKMELRGDWAYSEYQLRLLPGDYEARLVKADHQKDDFPINDRYEILLPDRRVFRGIVTGISE